MSPKQHQLCHIFVPASDSVSHQSLRITYTVSMQLRTIRAFSFDKVTETIADDKTVLFHPKRWQIICFSIKHLSNNSFLWPLLAPTIHPLTRRQLPLRSGASQFKVSRKEGELGLGELVLCHWKNPSSSPPQWSWSGLEEEYNLSSLPILFVVMTKRSCLNHHTYQEDPVRNTRKHDLTIELWIRMVKQRFKGFSWPNREHFGFAATESTKAKKRRQLTFGYYPGQSVRICSH